MTAVHHECHAKRMKLQHLVSWKVLALGAVGLLLILAFLVFHLNSGSENVSYNSFVHYAAPNNVYSFSYPSPWKNISVKQSNVAHLLYTVGGNQYLFTVSPPGQLTPESDGLVTWSASNVTYGEKQYSQTIWSRNGQPFYIMATPRSSDEPNYDLVMQLPPTNTSHYESLFGDIASTLK